ncbi:hypothetical protein KQX54_018726 [Cotesia glomerata]|uniref:Uncharacterized protein n=1 Tax=Cotesia glomerata TaxID=32391 RepID=A0AAV7IC09_COTGL|nr:hypothetical protein KQX54_018726 [Cotesia glomerata]
MFSSWAYEQNIGWPPPRRGFRVSLFRLYVAGSSHCPTLEEPDNIASWLNCTASSQVSVQLPWLVLLRQASVNLLSGRTRQPSISKPTPPVHKS